MDDFPVTLDFSRAIPLPIVPSPVEQQAKALQAAVFYAVQQDPDEYLKLLEIQKLTGIPPEVSKGNEQQIQRMLDAQRIDPSVFTITSPRTAAWASDPDQAAVAGVDEIRRLGRIEQNAAAMRGVNAPVDLTANPNGEGTYSMVGADGKTVQVPFSKVLDATHTGYRMTGADLGRYGDDAAVALQRARLAGLDPGQSTALAKADLTGNPLGEGTYEMVGPDGRTVQVPFSKVRGAQNLRYQVIPEDFRRYSKDAATVVKPGWLGGVPSDLYHNAVGGVSADQQAAIDKTHMMDAVANGSDPSGAGHGPIGFNKILRAGEGLFTAPLFTAEDVERHIANNLDEGQMARALSIQDNVRAGKVRLKNLSPEDRSLYQQLNAQTEVGKQVLATGFSEAAGAPIPEPMVDSALDFTGGMLSPSNVAMGAMLPESKAISGLFALQGAYGAYKSAVAAHEAYQSGDKETATKLATTAVLNGLMAGLAGSHAASGAVDGLGFEQGASEGLNEAGRELMGGRSATGPVDRSLFFENFKQALASEAKSELRGRAPEMHNDAMQTIFEGDTLRMSRQAFNDYWSGQSIDPVGMAAKLGVTFSVDAATGRAYAEVPTANYFSRLATKDREGLGLYVIDPASKLTLGQYEASRQQAAGGGPAKWQAQRPQNNAETAATSTTANPATNTPATTTPATVTPAATAPATGTPAATTSATATPATGTPAATTSATATPAASTPASSTPAIGSTNASSIPAITAGGAKPIPIGPVALNVDKQINHSPANSLKQNRGPATEKSMLTADPYEMLKYAGTGQQMGPVSRGISGFKERVDVGRVIGNHYDPIKKQWTPSTKIVIVYDGNNTVHIYPAQP